ncbi:MAG TPA: phytoene desaturase family protein [Gemmatimonadales bacterium]|nr:phytoene desaturase family protein [Gemmatimonadales bacterium]
MSSNPSVTAPAAIAAESHAPCRAGTPGGAAPGGRAARGHSRRARTAIVVGAGIGGLATAIRLARHGIEVTLLERHDAPGGRAGVWRSEEFTFDTGPSLVMMTECWHRLFRDAGRRLEDYLTLVQLDPCYRIHFPDGTTHDRCSDVERLAESFEAIEPGSAPRLGGFLAASGRMYADGLAFIGRNLYRPADMLRGSGLGMLGRHGALGDLRRLVGRYFKDERLRQSLSFQTLYLGLSPYEALAVYSLLPYVEIAGGIHYPMGGMHRLAAALERLATELGVRVRYGAEVARIEHRGDAATGVLLAGGERFAGDIVVSNADLPYTYARLLGEPYRGIERKRFSCSVVLLCLGVGRTYPHLLHHNFVVGRDLRAACEDLFVHHRMPEDPPLYVVATTRTDPGQAPPGCENVFALVLAPSQPRDRSRWIDWSIAGPRVEARALERMETTLGMTDLRRHIVTRSLVTPQTFLERYGNLRGEAFGLAHNLRQIGWFRPHNRHRRLRNLYFVGQSTHPGCGLPMVLISAECVVERALDDWGAHR